MPEPAPAAEAREFAAAFRVFIDWVQSSRTDERREVPDLIAGFLGAPGCAGPAAPSPSASYFPLRADPRRSGASRYIVRMSRGGSEMESIVKLLFGREAGILAKVLRPDDQGDSGRAEQVRRARQWCGGTPGRVITPSSRLTAYVPGMS